MNPIKSTADFESNIPQVMQLNGDLHDFERAEIFMYLFIL